MSDNVDNIGTVDTLTLEAALGLPEGAIAAQRRGERRTDLPITMDYGDFQSSSQTAYAANPVKEAVFVIDIASKEPTA
jgi:hypothetical protein